MMMFCNDDDDIHHHPPSKETYPSPISPLLQNSTYVYGTYLVSDVTPAGDQVVVGYAYRYQYGPSGNPKMGSKART
jgi:hypothetical protein